MKKLTFLLLAILFVSVSCEKFKERHDKETPCAVVSRENVPTAVVSALESKYAGVTVDKWFNKDNHGYTASFASGGVRKLAEFNNNGTFVGEDVENDGEEGEHEDDDDDEDDDEGCDCETE